MQSSLSFVKKLNRIRVNVLINVSLLFLAVYILNPTIISYDFQYYFLLIAVTIIGIPHGFFDYSIAQRLFNKNVNWIYHFTFGYIFLSILYFYLWIMMPLLALLIFLAISAFHFGFEEIPTMKYDISNYILVLILGSIPIILPILFHTDQVFFIFNQITDSNLAMIYVSIYIYILYFFLVLYSLYSIGMRHSMVYLILIPNLIILPPLISFILYFCFHHSIKHYIISIYDDDLVPEKYSIKGYLQIIIMASVFFTILTIFVLLKLSSSSIDIIIAKYIFILLACLTLPHLLLNIYYDIKTAKSFSIR